MPLPVIAPAAAAAARAGAAVGRAGARVTRGAGQAAKKAPRRIGTQLAKKAAAKEEEAAETQGMGALFSPEGAIMLSIAVVIDIIDFLIGSFFVLDIVAIFTIGIWIYFHSQRVTVTKGAAARLGKAAQWARRMRWLRPLLVVIEFIPVVGMLPCWILVVYFELKS